MLTLRRIDFGSTFCAVGARGFAGEGYLFHGLWRLFGMNWANTAFAGKTMTLLERNGQLDANGAPIGNMKLKRDGVTPIEYFPKCIWASLKNGGEMINNVSLSNFGAEYYLRRGLFHNIRKPYMVSTMLMEQTAEARAHELFQILHLFKVLMPRRVWWALQINFACPNTGHDNSAVYDEMAALVKQAKETLVDVPIVANVNAIMPTEVLLRVAEYAEALWIGNAIPFGDPRSTVNWKRFGVDAAGKPISPLSKRNPKWVGGLSSPDCLFDTIRAVEKVREHNQTIPIVAGNGIRTKDDVEDLKEAGANACFIGSLGTVRPWRMRGIIKHSNNLFSKE